MEPVKQKELMPKEGMEKIPFLAVLHLQVVVEVVQLQPQPVIEQVQMVDQVVVVQPMEQRFMQAVLELVAKEMMVVMVAEQILPAVAVVARQRPVILEQPVVMAAMA